MQPHRNEQPLPLSLNTLPPETILNIIQQDLPLSSLLALRQTSQRFYHHTGLALGQILPLDRESTLEVVDMLVRDLQNPGYQACNQCLRYHSKNRYSSVEWSKSAIQRQCLFSSTIRLCDHTILDFAQAQKILQNLQKVNTRRLDRRSVCEVCEESYFCAAASWRLRLETCAAFKLLQFTLPRSYV